MIITCIDCLACLMVLDGHLLPGKLGNYKLLVQGFNLVTRRLYYRILADIFPTPAINPFAYIAWFHKLVRELVY